MKLTRFRLPLVNNFLRLPIIGNWWRHKCHLIIIQLALIRLEPGTMTRIRLGCFPVTNTRHDTLR